MLPNKLTTLAGSNRQLNAKYRRRKHRYSLHTRTIHIPEHDKRNYKIIQTIRSREGEEQSIS